MHRRDIILLAVGLPLMVYAIDREGAIKLIVFGSKTLKVTDPRALLAAARKDKAGSSKTSFWEDRGWPKVITELAKQNDMTEDDLIDYLKDADYGLDLHGEPRYNPFFAMSELPNILEGIPDWARDQIIDDVVREVAADVERAVLEQFPELEGVET